MLLHKDKDRFTDVINATSAACGFKSALIEKDYYITLLLKNAVERIDGLVFKGGTSLSKCYNLIDRFSEDLDLSLDEEHFTQSKKRAALKELIKICDDLGLKLINRAELEKHSHGNYNCLEIEYPIIFSSEDINSHLKVEMTYIQKSYPIDVSKANSYIGGFLLKNGSKDIVAYYEMEPFDVKVQSLKRTVIDKVFALCDYYLAGTPERNSRHIYDIARLLTVVNLSDPELKSLVESVRIVRKPNKVCLSAQDGVKIPELIKEIIDSDFYKNDYNKTTLKLLLKSINYNEAIFYLNKIAISGIFDVSE